MAITLKHSLIPCLRARPSALLASLALAFGLSTNAQSGEWAEAAKAVDKKVISWRRDFHQHPELSNREFRTAKIVAEHLTALGFDRVETNVAHTGVVGVLKGAKPGRSVALRADMDALPVTEKVDLPFASKAKTEYDGQEVGVMHACGHDAHVSILMGVAEVLAQHRDQLAGSVTLIFQPAEEGAPEGEEGGAELMIKQGVLDGKPKPEAIFGLHVIPIPTGMVGYRVKGTMAASDQFKIVVKGKQTHGSSPWTGIDPIVVAGQIANAIQLIPARQLDITKAPAVISTGSIHGGVRSNIIPEEVTLVGTIRTFDGDMQDDLHRRLEVTATNIAKAAGATADVTVIRGYPVTYNDPALTEFAVPSLQKVTGQQGLVEIPPFMGAEDFSYYQKEIPGVFFMLGVNKPGVGPGQADMNHSPYFYVNEDALKIGVEALTTLAVDYLNQAQ
ncbi:amidohydrolase [Aestuariicella hydrocarbonica]|uniref:Amidohydrolase n=1 Tax=Pseudomaricurvus hydrocarbonicus TaxID=1470433 RepID=A0A9E5JU09_9GAMM|nr:amidohydrolase [Aestuariicella hydrocarbonica]NHO64545.1 amidohydrolase [Aestuariicella hydrocarbonica]